MECQLNSAIASDPSGAGGAVWLLLLVAVIGQLYCLTLAVRSPAEGCVFLSLSKLLRHSAAKHEPWLKA
jgi:hypothetical protein